MLGMEQVMVLFILIVVGVAVKKMNIVTEHINDEISRLVINICLPAFIISAMAFDFSVDVLINSGTLIVIAFSVYGVSIIIGNILTKVLGFTGASRDVYQYVAVFPNCGFMGYPVLHVAFGEEAVFYAAIYNLAFNALIWSYGVYVMKRSKEESKNEKRSILKTLKSAVNPAIVAILFGFFLFLTGLKLPGPVFQTVKMIGATTTPLSMMFIGFILADVHFKELFSEWRDIVITIHRLVVVPFLVYIVLTIFGVDGMTRIIPVVISAMPAAANTAIVASRYQSDYRLASKLIFTTTMVSIFTIPLVLTLL